MTNRIGLEIVRTRIKQLAERIDLNEAPDRLAKLDKLWEKFREEWDAGRKAEAISLMEDLDKEFHAAREDYAAWKQIFDALDLDRKMVESEVKIMKDINAIMTAEDAYQLSAELLGAIIESVNDLDIDPSVKRQILKRITYEFTTRLGDKSDRRPPGGGGEVIDSLATGVDREGIQDSGDEK